MKTVGNWVIWIIGYAVVLFLISAVTLRIRMARSLYISIVLVVSLFFGAAFAATGSFSARTPSILIVAATVWIGFQFAWVTSRVR